jgi:hypothetical protein
MGGRKREVAPIGRFIGASLVCAQSTGFGNWKIIRLVLAVLIS